jgi:general secretion pathway protein K
LVLVLIALATLSLIVAASVDAAQNFGREAFADMLEVRLNAAMDAAVATAGRDLAEAGVVPEALSRPQRYEIGDVGVTVEVKPLSGRIDLNAVDPALIAALLTASGVKPDRASKLAMEIADWRDADNDARKDGAEAAEYIAAGRGYVPTDRAFESVSELGMVLDGGADLADCLAPDATVLTQGAETDPRFASLKLQRAMHAIGAALDSPSVSVIGGRILAGGSLFEIAVTARDSNSGRAASSLTVVRITGSQADPLWILSQLRPAPRAADAAAACKRLAAR